MVKRALERDILESEQSLGSAPRFDNERLPEVKVFNPWIVALVVTMGTFMEVLDSSIANVALHISLAVSRHLLMKERGYSPAILLPTQ